ncbi:MAG: DUF488 domain-containing protein [Isosphaeraceae bacterium]
MSATLWTIGHSTRELADFVGLLAESSIELVADVRRFPGSARYPHFNAEELALSLEAVGVVYRHYEDLGGRRGKREKGSPNTGWRVEAFNAFADFMATPPFASALDDLTSRALELRTVVMCSEAVPWRCHRRLIADALTARGWLVQDILGRGKVKPHVLTDFVRFEGERITYPAEPLFPEE